MCRVGRTMGGWLNKSRFCFAGFLAYTREKLVLKERSVKVIGGSRHESK